jgi:hypothetical protein
MKFTTTTPICDHRHTPPRMDSSPLFSLPPELIFQILDFMEPHEYSGFSCTCRHAVTLVNRKLDNPKDKEELYSWLRGSRHYDSEAPLRLYLPPRKTRTARYVDKRAMSEYLSYRESDCGKIALVVDPDPDL